MFELLDPLHEVGTGRPREIVHVLRHETVHVLRDSPLAEARKITLTLKPASNLPPVRADELQLYRAIQEVVENALEYTPENGTVTVSTFSKETYGILEVQDTGTGIADDLMPHLFEKFYHFNLLTSAPEKLGLGLPIAKKIIDQHTGTISVESASGKGTTFTIAIPLHSP